MSHRIRYVMVGGFLGAGKTTTLGRLAGMYRDRGQTVGIVTNDQAEGLVDTASLRGQGFEVGEVAGACFCCQFDNLVSTVRTLAESGVAPPDVILAEPVGSCTDLVATVIRPLKDLFAAEFDVAPYAVILKPGHASKVLGKEAGTGFSPKAEYILRKQLEEADAVLINRVDELPAAEVDALEALVEREIPGKPIVRISARTGVGFDALMTVLDGEGSGGVTPELDYDLYAEGEAELAWYNGTAEVSAADAFALDALLTDVIGRMKEALAERDFEAAHLKAVGVADGGFGVANLVSSDGAVTLSAASDRTVPAGGTAELILNARVAGDPGGAQSVGERDRAGRVRGPRRDRLAAGRTSLPPRTPRAHPPHDRPRRLERRQEPCRRCHRVRVRLLAANTAAAAIAAVSVRKIGVGNEAARTPAAAAACTSSSVNPPSGPIRIACGPGAGGANRSPVTWNSVAEPHDARNVSKGIGSTISGSRSRRDCLQAASAVARSLSSLPPPGSTVERSHRSGTIRATPSSVAFSINQRNRSPFGAATASVNGDIGGSVNADGSQISSATVLAPFPRTACTVAAARRPAPSNSSTASPGPSRRTAARCFASVPPSVNGPATSGGGTKKRGADMAAIVAGAAGRFGRTAGQSYSRPSASRLSSHRVRHAENSSLKAFETHSPGGSEVGRNSTPSTRLRRSTNPCGDSLECAAKNAANETFPPPAPAF